MWLNSSINGKWCFAPQVAGDASGQLGGPALGRLNRDGGGAQLLSSYDVFLEGAFADGADVTALLKAAGAKLLSRAPVTGSTSKGRMVVVLVDDGTQSQPGDTHCCDAHQHHVPLSTISRLGRRM